jgi:uncharacterized protein YpuA (DUF1002 family)
VSKVKSILEIENKKYDDRWVRGLDEQYFIQHINFHSIISQVLSDIRFQIGQDFKQFRRNRDDADYELSLIFRRAETEDIIEQIEKLIRSIKAI